MEKGLCKLDEEGTDEDMIFNCMEEEEIDISCEIRSKFLWHVDLGDIKAIANVNGEYVTTKHNAIKLTELYGWKFVDLNIIEM